MKKITAIATLLIVLTSCSKENIKVNKAEKNQPTYFKVVAINLDGSTITSQVFVVK
jgi:hypothetical protein